MRNFLSRFFHQLKRGIYPLHCRQISKDGMVDISPHRPPSSFQSKQDTTSAAIGVGVYRGEAIAFQTWGVEPPSPIWVVTPLQRFHLACIDKELSSKLLCLAHYLATCQQSPQPMTHSGMLDIIKLNGYPPVSQHTSPPSTSFEEAHDTDATLKMPDNQQGQEWQPPICSLEKILEFPCSLSYQKTEAVEYPQEYTPLHENPGRR